MKIEYCQKCDRPIKPEEKAYTKDGQILCEECYLRTSKIGHKGTNYEMTSKELLERVEPTTRTDELVKKEVNEVFQEYLGRKKESEPQIDPITDSKRKKMGILLKCRDCGTLVSKSAKRCPHCGASEPWKAKSNIIAEYVIASIIFIGLVVALKSCVFSPLNNAWKEARVVVNSRRRIRGAQKQYDDAKAELEGVRAWAELETAKSNAILQDIVNSVVGPSGELLVPEKQAQSIIDKAMKDCEIRGRIIDAKVEAFEQKVREASDKLATAKEKVGNAGVNWR